jgi:hypothetical protein
MAARGSQPGGQRPSQGWLDHHDPFKVRWKKRTLQIDLGAEQLVAATKGNLSIAVEIKSFIGANDLEDLYQALGQFILYRKALSLADPDRVLYLAVSAEAYRQLLDDPEGEALPAEERINLLVFDREKEEIVFWKR